MKRKSNLSLLMFVAILFFFGMISLQTEARKVEGKIYLEEDTLNVTVRMRTDLFGEIQYPRMQHKIVYFDSTGVKHKAKPKHIRGFGFPTKNGYQEMLSKKFGSKMGVKKGKCTVFLHVLENGKCKLFDYYVNARINIANEVSGLQRVPYKIYLFQREDGRVWWPHKIPFRKQMKGQFPDCPELTRKIIEREFRHRDLRRIVRYYNSECRK